MDEIERERENTMTYTQFQAVVEEVLCGSSFQME